MQKAHVNQNWKNKPLLETPLNAANLNRLDLSVDEIDDRVITLDTVKANQSDLLQTVKNVTFDRTNGTFTFIRFNNTTFSVDTDLEKISVNFDYDDDPTSAHYQQLVITLIDGTVKYIDMSALITQFEFVDSAFLHFTVTLDGKVSATIIDGSITESKLEPNFLANCRLEVSKAEGFAQEAESWANGQKDGVDVPSTDPAYNNHAKKYAQDSAASATASAGSASAAAVSAGSASDAASRAALSATAADGSATNAATSESNAQTYANNANTSANNAYNSATEAARQVTLAANQVTLATNQAERAEAEADIAESFAGDASDSADDAAQSASDAAQSVTDAAAQVTLAAGQVTLATEQAVLAESYTHGNTGARQGEGSDNCEYYKDRCEAIVASLDNPFTPMGTIHFNGLPATITMGHMYNIDEDFTSDSRFEDGGGKLYLAGTNVYGTANSKWDCLSGTVPVINGKSGSQITLDGRDILLTGYSKPSSGSAITALDSTNAAIGKLEALMGELGESVADGKASLASAITDKGVTTASDASFATMAANIELIETAGTYQDKSVSPSAGQQVITADEGYDALSSVTVNAISPYRSAGDPATYAMYVTYDRRCVYFDEGFYPSATVKGSYVTITAAQVKSLTDFQAKTITPTTSEQVITADEGYDAMWQVIVNPVSLQTKTVDASASAAVEVTPDSGYMGLSKVTITQIPLTTKTVSPTTSNKTYTPGTGYVGFSSVTVKKYSVQAKTADASVDAAVVVTPDSGYVGLSKVTISQAPKTRIGVYYSSSHKASGAGYKDRILTDKYVKMVGLNEDDCGIIALLFDDTGYKIDDGTVVVRCIDGYNTDVFGSSINTVAYLGGNSYPTKGIILTHAGIKTLPTLPFSFKNGCAVFYKGEIHILGTSASTSYYKAHYKLKSDFSAWVSVSTLPYNFYNGAAVSIVDSSGKEYIDILSGAGNSTAHYRWNGSTWTSKSTLPYSASGLSAVSIEWSDNIYIFGGGTTTANRKKFYKYNGSSWTGLTSMPIEFTGGCASVAEEYATVGSYDHYFFVMGSTTNPTKCYMIKIGYAGDVGTWKEVYNTANNISFGRHAIVTSFFNANPFLYTIHMINDRIGVMFELSNSADYIYNNSGLEYWNIVNYLARNIFRQRLFLCDDMDICSSY